MPINQWMHQEVFFFVCLKRAWLKHASEKRNIERREMKKHGFSYFVHLFSSYIPITKIGYCLRPVSFYNGCWELELRKIQRKSPFPWPLWTLLLKKGREREERYVVTTYVTLRGWAVLGFRSVPILYGWDLEILCVHHYKSTGMTHI